MNKDWKDLIDALYSIGVLLMMTTACIVASLKDQDYKIGIMFVGLIYITNRLDKLEGK